MKVVITIAIDSEAFNGKDCGSELARMLRAVAEPFEFEPKATMLNRQGANPKQLFDRNGEPVGTLVVQE